MQEEDRIILEYIATKNSDLFDEIYEKYKNLVYFMVLQAKDVIKSPDSAVQEIFYKVFLSIDSYNYKCGSFKTWILAITRNYIIDCSRKKDNVEYNDELVSNAVDPNTYESNGLMDFLETFLTKDEVQLIVLKFVYNFKYKHIAEHLGITVDQCKKEVKRIKDLVNKERDKNEEQF